MNKPQRIKMMAELWPAACAFNHWNPKDDAKRYEVFAKVLTKPASPRRAWYLSLIEEKGYISTSDLINEDDISAVFKEMKDLAAKVTTYDPKQKQLLWVVRNQLRPCLALYKEFPDAYIASILKERHKIFNGVSTIEDLSAQPRPGQKHSDLKMFIFTLTNRIDAMRSDAGDSGHEMCERARVRCKCADCKREGEPWFRNQAAPADSEVPEDAELQPTTEDQPF